MKNLFLALGLGLALFTPSLAFADIAPEPEWYREVYDVPAEDGLAGAEPYAEPVVAEDTGEITPMNDVTSAPLAGSTGSGESSWRAFTYSLYATIIIELVAAAVAIALLRQPLHALLAVPVASLVTLPIFWGAMTAAIRSGVITTVEGAVFTIIVAELLIILAETAMLHLAHPKALNVRQALVVSAIMNIASLIVGVVLGLGT